MEKYFKYFGIPLIITLLTVIVGVTTYVTKKDDINPVRSNDAFDSSVAVYDMADKLTESEEIALQELIDKMSVRACADIAIVTLDDPELGYLSAVREYADQFSEEMQMGYHGPGTEAIVFVDNWSRGGDGKIHSWVSTTESGLRSRLTDSDCTEILYILDEIPSDDADPYEQYYKIIVELANEARPFNPPFGVGIVFIIALVVSAIYIALNWNSKLGKVTVQACTYVKDGEVDFAIKSDTFRNKTVSKVKIQSSSGGSGGGGGGGSHGGGGHSR